MPKKEKEELHFISVIKLTYLSLLRGGIGTLSLRGTGCQGFTGPFPSAFLDKNT